MKKIRVSDVMISNVFTVLLLIFVLISGCVSPPPIVQARATDDLATEESVSYLSDAANNFSINMYKELIGNQQNLFFSPYSIYVALSMVYEGARGQTADQMKQVLGFEQNDSVNLCSFGKIYNLLNIDVEYTLNTANAIWAQENYPFLESYLSFIEQYYMGEISDVDFSERVSVVKEINSWIEENTGGKIKNMISKDDIDPLTVMILSNAIYFKGLWKTQFEVEDTIDRNFFIGINETVQVPTMTLSDVSVNYTETDDFQLIELPYKGDAVSMILILPTQHDMSVLNSKITAQNLSILMNAMEMREIDVFLPKFSFKTEYDLNQVLSTMGIDIAFDSTHANFSGMNGVGGLYIDKVKHNAFIDVTEEGSEAAAATTVHMTLTAVPDQIVFDANHPFMFLIYHKLTDTILFMGDVYNPLV